MMYRLNLKHYIGVVLMGAMLHSFAMAEVIIPDECSTPGSCPELNVTAKELTVNQSITLTNAVTGYKTTLEAPKDVEESVDFALPVTNGKGNQVLIVDENGTLVWQDAPDKDRYLGMIGFMIPNPEEHIYEINGSTVTDSKLAAYINEHPIDGFTVDGDTITMPDWRGRYLGARGGLEIPDTAGSLMASANKAHTHTLIGSKGAHEKKSESGSVTAAYTIPPSPGNKTTESQGETYARPMTVAMPIVIVGGSL